MSTDGETNNFDSNVDTIYLILVSKYLAVCHLGEGRGQMISESSRKVKLRSP